MYHMGKNESKKEKKASPSKDKQNVRAAPSIMQQMGLNVNPDNHMSYGIEIPGKNDYTKLHKPNISPSPLYVKPLQSDPSLSGINFSRASSYPVQRSIGPGGYGKAPHTPIPGDADYKGTVPSGSWKLVPKGDGAHLVERSNVKSRSAFGCFDQADTPRFYPYGTPENAGKAHIRLHEATRGAGVKLRGGNPGMSDADMLKNYEAAYSSASLSGIKGDLRTPSSDTVVATDVTPAEAYAELRKWGKV